MVDRTAQDIMNEIESKADHVRRTRRKLDQTWAEIAPKLTVYGLVDETVGQLMEKRRSNALLSAVAIAGSAWLFNAFRMGQNPFKFTKSKTANSKQEIKNHESSNAIRRHS